MRTRDLWIISLGLTLPTFVQAESQDPCCGVKFNGYVDASYNYLESANQFTTGIDDRMFDIKEHGFTLQQLAATFAYQPEYGFGGLVNALYGRDAIATGAYDWDTQTGEGPIGFDVLQAYGQYASSPTTVVAGRFVTLAGAEVVDATVNQNFSRSLLFSYAIPISHLGIRAYFRLQPHLQLTVGVNNGWDNVSDTGRDKTLEFGALYQPCEKLLLSASAYSGEERIIPRTHSGLDGRRNLIDLVATYKLTDYTSIVANYDYGVQHNVSIDQSAQPVNAVWQGLALYYNYIFSPIWRFSVRGEVFDDRDGYRTGIRQTLKELTFTAGYLPFKNFEIRGETRRDFSNENAYQDRHSDRLRDVQQSYALEVIYKFSNGQKAKSHFMLEPMLITRERPATPRSPIQQPVVQKPSLPPLSRDEQHLMAMNPNHYVIQLLAASIDANVEQFIVRHGLQGQAFYFHTLRDGKDWYAVVYGEYPTKEAANQAKAALQQQYHVRPWVRSVTDIQQEIVR